jgi:hypothetical protein
VDKNGYVANYVETEQMLISKVACEDPVINLVYSYHFLIDIG